MSKPAQEGPSGACSSSSTGCADSKSGFGAKTALEPTPTPPDKTGWTPIFQKQPASEITDAGIAVINTERLPGRHVAGFLQGLSLGLAHVAPIGMQNLFVINSALSHSLKRALAVALLAHSTLVDDQKAKPSFARRSNSRSTGYSSSPTQAPTLCVRQSKATPSKWTSLPVLR